MTISVTNPFLYTYPITPLPRIHDSHSDVEVAAGICRAMGKLTEDQRFVDYWKFIEEGKARPYIQRVLDHSNATRGYKIADLEQKAEQGIPVILQTRTQVGSKSMKIRRGTPRRGGWNFTVKKRNFKTVARISLCIVSRLIPHFMNRTSLSLNHMV